MEIAVDDLLSNPVEGQIWLNSTTDSPYFWDGTRWVPFGMVDDYAANSGRIAHGEQIPLPVSTTGYGGSKPQFNEEVYDEDIDSIIKDENLTLDK